MKLRAIIFCIFAVGNVASGADHRQFARISIEVAPLDHIDAAPNPDEPGSFEPLPHPI